MNRHSLPLHLHAAFMAGVYHSDIEKYMSMARSENQPRVRCIWVRAARDSHRKYREFLVRALASQR